MKKCSRFMIMAVIGAALQVVAIKYAYVERGKLVYGGEWLIFPMVMMLHELVEQVTDFCKEKMGGKEYDRIRDFLHSN